VLQCVAVCRLHTVASLCGSGGRACSVVLQCCVAVCCSVLQCVAVCCSVLQCVAVCKLHTVASLCGSCGRAGGLLTAANIACVAECCSVLQCVAVYCNVLQCVAVRRHCVALCESGISTHNHCPGVT